VDFFLDVIHCYMPLAERWEHFALFNNHHIYLYFAYTVFPPHTHNTQPFYGLLDFVQDYPVKPIKER